MPGSLEDQLELTTQAATMLSDEPARTDGSRLRVLENDLRPSGIRLLNSPGELETSAPHAVPSFP